MHCECVERAENEPRYNEVHAAPATAFSRCILSKVPAGGHVVVAHYANSRRGVRNVIKNCTAASFHTFCCAFAHAW